MSEGAMENLKPWLQTAASICLATAGCVTLLGSSPSLGLSILLGQMETVITPAATRLLGVRWDDDCKHTSSPGRMCAPVRYRGDSPEARPSPGGSCLSFIPFPMGIQV